jgi:hypothetical protein
MENYSKMSNDDLVRWCRDHNWRDEAAAKILFERTYPLISAVVRAKKYRKEWPLHGLDPVDGPPKTGPGVMLGLDHKEGDIWQGTDTRRNR